MKKQLKKILQFIAPDYAYVPILATLAIGNLLYFCNAPLRLSIGPFDLSFSFEDRLPFVPFFVSFYILAYLQWAWHYVYHFRKSRSAAYHYATSEILGKLVGFFFFILLPTEIVRPTVSEGGLWNTLTAWIYETDAPINLFPSLHCLSSWLCFRASLEMKCAPRWYAPAQLAFSILVFLSTVLIKQHFVVDIFAGIAVAELGWFFSRRFSLWKIFERIELPCVRRTREPANGNPSSKDGTV